MPCLCLYLMAWVTYYLTLPLIADAAVYHTGGTDIKRKACNQIMSFFIIFSQYIFSTM